MQSHYSNVGTLQRERGAGESDREEDEDEMKEGRVKVDVNFVEA